MEEEEVECTPFEHGGKMYYKDGEGTLYDPATQEPVAKWNAEKGVIEEYNEDE